VVIACNSGGFLSLLSKRGVDLSYAKHDRDVAGLKYIYPVVSRRAKGVSIGVNLNPNNACNYRCIYCQVPDLTYGKGPKIDIPQLERELRLILQLVNNSDFFEKHVPERARRLNDVALAGNGEPTSSPDFCETIDVISNVLGEFELRGSIKIVLITNGTLINKPGVQRGLDKLSRLNGEVWFKLDSATREGFKRIHSINMNPEKHLARLRRSAEICPTWIQTCFFAQNGAGPSDEEQRAYLACLRSLAVDNVPIRGVFLYSLARPSLRPEGATLSSLPKPWLDDFARKIRLIGIPVEVC
jgi:wyosine [tRNA(Phe)-imidazoG37] synthetase (radical SAM superfamily)